jgi:hypothetical protein
MTLREILIHRAMYSDRNKMNVLLVACFGWNDEISGFAPSGSKEKATDVAINILNDTSLSRREGEQFS